MAGRGAAVISGAQLRGQVAALGRDLGLEVDVEVRVGRRIRGAQRRIDAVLRHPETRVSPGVGCSSRAPKGPRKKNRRHHGRYPGVADPGARRLLR